MNIKINLHRAGIEMEEKRLVKMVFNISIILNLIISAYFLWVLSSEGASISYAIILMVVTWIIFFAATLLIAWLVLSFFLDILIYRRHLTIEEVLSSYFQLAAANLRAGMTPDQALWNAVRPQFGILAKEMELVAKQTFAGLPLKEALKEFSERYDSKRLTYSINLIIAGIESGSELGDILNKISLDIQESRTLKQEMAANVSTYAIFIGTAVLFGSPLLLALTYQILIVIGSIMSSIDLPAGSFISLSGTSIAPGDFYIFALIMVFITSLMSSMIISMILKGNIKEGIKYTLFMIPSSMTIFVFATWFLGLFISSIFQM